MKQNVPNMTKKNELIGWIIAASVGVPALVWTVVYYIL